MYIDEKKIYEYLIKAEIGKEYEIATKMPSDNRFFLKVEDRLTSTNTVLKAMAEDCKDKDFLLIANEQTAGKGRMGRSFQSPEGGGIYMSLLLHPQLSAEDSLFLTTAAAVAVSKTIDEVTGMKTGIKWVNDVFLDDKKICGILTEAKIKSGENGLEYAVVGIGINVEAPEEGFNEEIKSVAGAVYRFGESPDGVKNKIIAGVVSRFYECFQNIGHSRNFIEEYKKRSCILGKTVKIIDNIFEPGKAESAVAVDIDEKCRLIVRYQDGTIKSLSSGEVSVRF